MKKSIFFYALKILIIISCAKTELVNNNEEVLSKSETIDFNDIDESTINPLAREYFENVVTTMFVTGILENTKNSDDNPFLEKLENFDIELEDGSNGSIYDLNLNEKEAFINKWAIIESYEMSQRISQDKVIEFDVLTQNKIVSKALEMSGVTQVTKSNIGAPQINSAELFKYIREGYEEFAKIAEEEADLFISSI